MNWQEHGFYRLSLISPPLVLGQPLENSKIIKDLASDKANQLSSILLFPELSLTGFTCEDLFFSSHLLKETKTALNDIINFSREISQVMIVGAPWQTEDGRMWNLAFVIQQGKIHGAVPKTHLPGYGEFYDYRWFCSGLDIEIDVYDSILGEFCLSSRQIFQMGELCFAIEICEDLWAPIPPSSYHCLQGAHLILNLSASNEVVGKVEYRRGLIQQQSARFICAYAYASSGIAESTKDIVFSGHCVVAENGSLVTENQRFQDDSAITTAEIDLDKLQHDRRVNTTFQYAPRPKEKYHRRQLCNQVHLSHLARTFSPTPFIPREEGRLQARTKEILNIQVSGLVTRIQRAKFNLVVGVSGGLDSTLALLICCLAMDRLSRQRSDIFAISMPGFGTTKQTKDNGECLSQQLGVTFQEIPIHSAVEQHLSDLKHSMDCHDVVYENAQARERTQILFNMANKVKGIVVGTGDLSELALGWCTYNGDQNSNYNVNISIPKTLVQYLIRSVALDSNAELKQVLHEILETPISPELLPPSSDGSIQQKTEDIVGPYLLHDFFLFHYVRNGFAPDKIYHMAKRTFADLHSGEEIETYLQLFLRRFHLQQFKRTCSPPGPKVGSVSLSPRGDWRMPDETYLNWSFIPKDQK